MRKIITLTGYLGSDPEIRETAERTCEVRRWNEVAEMHDVYEVTVPPREYLRLSLATHRREGGTWQTRWHQLVIWHPERMEFFPARLSRKGQRIKVRGTFHTFTFTGENGEERELERFIVTEFQRLPKKGQLQSPVGLAG